MQGASTTSNQLGLRVDWQRALASTRRQPRLSQDSTGCTWCRAQRITRQHNALRDGKECRCLLFFTSLSSLAASHAGANACDMYLATVGGKSCLQGCDRHRLVASDVQARRQSANQRSDQGTTHNRVRRGSCNDQPTTMATKSRMEILRKSWTEVAEQYERHATVSCRTCMQTLLS